MRNCIGRIFERLARVVRPGPDRARTTVMHFPSGQDAPTLRLPRVYAVPAQPVLRGEDVGLVRPYLVAHERQQEARRKIRARAESVCAPHGVVVAR